MNRHLDDEQIATLLIGAELEPEAREHLEVCLDCRGKVASTARLIELRRRSIDDGAPDWKRQHAAVLDRLPVDPASTAARRGRWLRPLIAAAAALIVVAVVAVMRPRPAEIASNGSDIAVEDILAEVDALLADDSIPGFEIIDPGVDELESFVSEGTS